MQNSSPLILIDGSSYLYRAYHAMPSLTNSRGEPTGAIYGVVNMLRSLLSEYDPSLIVAVFDAKGKTFRHDLFKDYKATRPPMPDDLRGQIEPLHEIVCALGIPLLCIDGVEADDVIGTLAVQAARDGVDTLISTGDKDLAQLVGPHVKLINTMNNTHSNDAGVLEKFGVRPDQIIDYLTLVGDSVDNIPGVPKVGPKTAVKWLEQYGSLDNIITHADEISGKVGENLRSVIGQLPLSRQLATIKTDVKLDLAPQELKRMPPNKELLRDWFSRLEFKRWLAEVSNSATSGDNVSPMVSTNDTDTNYQTITDNDHLKQWLEQLKSAQLIAFDTETTALDYMQAEIVGVSFATEAGKAAYVPLAHDYENAPTQLDRDQTLALLRPLLEDPKLAKVGQNLKYDMHVLHNHGIDMQGVAFDTMLESYVLNSVATRHDMDSLALKYLSHKTIHFEDVAGTGKNQLRFNQIPIEQAAPYAAEDADITLRLHQTLWPQLEAQDRLGKLLTEIEVPLIPVLVRMEETGVLIDTKMLKQQSKELAKGIAAAEKEAHDVAGEAFNLSSPKQIQTILFEKLGLPVVKKTPKGQPSTAEDVLQELALDYPLPKLILNYRSLSKLKSTYTDKLPEQVTPRTGRVHTSYHQAVASTGRLSSTEPNLQNIPIRSAEGRRIRQAFVAAKGCKILAADYSQIELRIMAHLSGDQGLLTAFAKGVDVHRATAAEVFGLEPEAVSNEHRRRAKAINFGLIYGMSAFGLGKQLGIGRNEAQEYVDLYFQRYPGVKQFMDDTREQAREQGYVTTVCGRRLYLPDIKHSNGQRRQYAERTAINAPMQGTAADIIKLAMIAVDKWIQKDQPNIKMIMQVHDELVFEIPQEYIAQAERRIRELMTTVIQLNVPLQVDIGTGENWDEAH